MSKFQSLVAFVALCLSHSRLVAGAIGPVADLTISNANISPDGFTRSAVVVNNQFPGPLVTGNKVRFPAYLRIYDGQCSYHLVLGRQLPAQRHRQSDQRHYVDCDHHCMPVLNGAGIYIVTDEHVFPSALAWFLPEGHELGRRWGIRQPVSHLQGQLLPVRLLSAQPSRHVLVPQSFVDAVLRRSPWTDGSLRPQ